MGICQSSEPKTPPMSSRDGAFKYDPSGRRLHADLTPLSEDTVSSDKLYSLPNDDEEMDRLHLQHYIVRLMFLGNFSAPVNSVLRRKEKGKEAKVLDLGCGSGIWCFEVFITLHDKTMAVSDPYTSMPSIQTGTQYPAAKITGMDISPVQPSTVKPANVKFITGDLTTLPLPFEDASFDFIYMRFLIAGLRADYWPTLINELARIV
ncbi:hypothetical protein HDV00_011871 [Rhizophlyctis rosea]|nr:hypothetical protein HDV00_011871 [Rhizophlyctis rosea]